MPTDTYVITVTTLIQPGARPLWRLQISPPPIKVAKEKIWVSEGSRVAWLVQVRDSNGWTQPGYRLIFPTDQCLGTTIVDVTQGGPSGFFSLKALGGSGFKYTVEIPSLGLVRDPEIQIETNSFAAAADILSEFTATSNYVIAVTKTSGSYSYTYTKDGGGSATLPSSLAVKVGDSIVYSFHDPAGTASDFSINFQSDNLPRPNPFQGVAGSIVRGTLPSGNDKTTDSLVIGRVAGQSYPWMFQEDEELPDNDEFTLTIT